MSLKVTQKSPQVASAKELYPVLCGENFLNKLCYCGVSKLPKPAMKCLLCGDTIGHWGDRWFTHPTPNMGEPDKQICWLSDIHS